MNRKDISLFLKFYFDKNMPRDKHNYKFRFQEAWSLVKWSNEMDKSYKEYLDNKQVSIVERVE